MFAYTPSPLPLSAHSPSSARPPTNPHARARSRSRPTPPSPSAPRSPPRIHVAPSRRRVRTPPLHAYLSPPSPSPSPPLAESNAVDSLPTFLSDTDFVTKQPHHNINPEAVKQALQEKRSVYYYNLRLKDLARRKNRLNDCLALLEELRAAGLKPDKFTYSSLLTACATAKAPDTAMALFASLSDEHLPLDNHLRGNLLTIAASAKPPRLDFCVRVFRDSSKPNRLMCNVIMDAFARCGRVDDCLTTFRYMGRRALVPDAYTAAALVKAFVVSGRLKDAVAKIEEMHMAGLSIPSAAFGQVIDAFGKKAMMDEAVAVFDMMTLYGVEPTQITYNILIAACAHVKMPERAFDIFEEMKHTSGFLGDRYTYHSLMNVCLSVQDTDRVVQLYREIHKSPFQCNQVSYRYALTAAGQAMDLDFLHEIATDIKATNCTPREDTFAALVAAAIRGSDLQAALEFFSEYVNQRRGHVETLFDAIRNALRSFETGRGNDFEQTSRVVAELERSWRRGHHS